MSEWEGKLAFGPSCSSSDLQVLVGEKQHDKNYVDSERKKYKWLLFRHASSAAII